LQGVGLTPPDPLDPPGTEGGTIAGTVTRDNAGPVAGVSVDLFTLTPGGGRGEYLATATTNDAGDYTFPDLQVGCYNVTFIAPDGERFIDDSQYFRADTCIEALETDTLNAILADIAGNPTAITGVVDRVDAGPVDNVDVDLFTANADGSRGQYLRSTRTDTNGSYRFDVTPGCYVVTFVGNFGETFTNGSRWLSAGSCPDSGQTEIINATMTAIDTGIRGTVSREGQGGVSGVVVDLFVANGDGSRGQWLTSSTTDGVGNYLFDPVADGCYILTFIAPAGETFTNGSQWFQPGVCINAGEGQTINAILSAG
jgi:5-hydroxyisourate hydrolase-like protein (transthyretin family)